MRRFCAIMCLVMHNDGRQDLDNHAHLVHNLRLDLVRLVHNTRLDLRNRL